MRSLALLSIFLALPSSAACIWPWSSAVYTTQPPTLGKVGRVTAYRWHVDGAVVETQDARLAVACGSGELSVSVVDAWGNESPSSEAVEPPALCLGLEPGVVLTSNHFTRWFVPAYRSGLPVCGI